MAGWQIMAGPPFGHVVLIGGRDGAVIGADHGGAGQMRRRGGMRGFLWGDWFKAQLGSCAFYIGAIVKK
jgi:hypothetical protein